MRLILDMDRKLTGLLPDIGNAQNAASCMPCCAADLSAARDLSSASCVAWVMLLRVLRRRDLLKPVERLTLIQTAGILAFFTMRSYPENSAALYSVDLLVLLPAIVFIAEADRKLRRIVLVRVVRRSADYSEPAVAHAPVVLVTLLKRFPA